MVVLGKCSVGVRVMGWVWEVGERVGLKGMRWVRVMMMKVRALMCLGMRSWMVWQLRC